MTDEAQKTETVETLLLFNHMPHEEKKLSEAEIAAKMSGISEEMSSLKEKARRFRILTARAEELGDDVENSLAHVEEKVHQVQASISPKNSTKGSVLRRRRRRRPDLLAGRAAPRAGSVRLVKKANGWAEAEIDSRKIPLTPLLATLLEILKAEGGIVKDALVGWKLFDAVQAALQQNTRRPHSKHSISQLVSRLRQLLEDHGLSSDLVQTNELLGAYRFALARPGPGPLTVQSNH